MLSIHINFTFYTLHTVSNETLVTWDCCRSTRWAIKPSANRSKRTNSYHADIYAHTLVFASNRFSDSDGWHRALKKFVGPTDRTFTPIIKRIVVVSSSFAFLRAPLHVAVHLTRAYYCDYYTTISLIIRERSRARRCTNTNNAYTRSTTVAVKTTHDDVPATICDIL